MTNIVEQTIKCLLKQIFFFNINSLRIKKKMKQFNENHLNYWKVDNPFCSTHTIKQKYGLAFQASFFLNAGVTFSDFSPTIHKSSTTTRTHSDSVSRKTIGGPKFASFVYSPPYPFKLLQHKDIADEDQRDWIASQRSSKM